MFNDLLRHRCDIFSITTSNDPDTNEVLKSLVLESAGNKCKFDVKPTVVSAGVLDTKRGGEFLLVRPLLFLPLRLSNGYSPRINDLVVRRDTLDPQYQDKTFRIIDVRNTEAHHWEGLLELVEE